MFIFIALLINFVHWHHFWVHQSCIIIKYNETHKGKKMSSEICVFFPWVAMFIEKYLQHEKISFVCKFHNNLERGTNFLGDFELSHSFDYPIVSKLCKEQSFTSIKKLRILKLLDNRMTPHCTALQKSCKFD